MARTRSWLSPLSARHGENTITEHASLTPRVHRCHAFLPSRQQNFTTRTTKFPTPFSSPSPHATSYTLMIRGKLTAFYDKRDAGNSPLASSHDLIGFERWCLFGHERFPQAWPTRRKIKDCKTRPSARLKNTHASSAKPLTSQGFACDSLHLRRSRQTPSGVDRVRTEEEEKVAGSEKHSSARIQLRLDRENFIITVGNLRRSRRLDGVVPAGIYR